MGTKLLTGVPRSGTTLCCYLLNQYENTVALHEPIKPELFVGTRQEALGLIREFSDAARSRLLEKKTIITKQRNGKLPTNPVKDDHGALRKEAVDLGIIKINKALDEKFTLFVKHNALFTALLEELVDDFDVYALVRNPMSVLVSWHTVDLPVHFGQLPMGEKFDESLSSQLEDAASILQKQLTILAWFYKRYDHLIESSRIIRFEDVLSSEGSVLQSIFNHSSEKIHFDREERANRLSLASLKQLHHGLLSHGSVAEPFYSSSEIDAEYHRIME